jgi:UDP-glucuronate decarboxylase
MKILVTGGAGFLGSWLCQALHNQGHDILCVDNLSTGKIENIENLLNLPRFQFLFHDVSEPLNPGYIDQIYNLACPASPKHYSLDPVKTVKTCVLGAINMLDLALKYKARILQTSTSEIYGDPLEHPQKETYWGNVNPIGPRSCYDEGKRCAETLFYDYNRQHSVDIRVARIFNTYGPHMTKDDGRVVSNFIIQALDNQDITIYGQGQQTRSFCYVSDLIDGLIKLQNSSVTQPVNLGNPQEHTIKQIAEIILQLTKSTSNICYNDLPKDDPQRRRPDISQANELLDWLPAISLEQGLLKTIEYFVRQNHEIATL